MPEKLSPRPSPAYRRVPSRRSLRPPKPIIRRAASRARKQQPRRILSRSASEPILYTVRFDAISRNEDAAAEIDKKHRNLFLLRPHTFTDGGFFSSSSSLPPPSPSPSPPRPNFMIEEAKVVVSVTVEGSPGPVRAMVKLGATVDEAIGVVVDRYKREGRSPRLDCERPDSFELHHSHFSLQSLNKSAKIGEVGSRSFYLRQSCSSHSSFNSASEGRNSTGGSEVEIFDSRIQTVPPPPAHLFFSFIAKRFSKIKRRTKRLWRVLACITCV